MWPGNFSFFFETRGQRTGIIQLSCVCSGNCCCVLNIMPWSVLHSVRLTNSDGMSELCAIFTPLLHIMGICSSPFASRYGDPFTTFVSDRVNEGAPGTPTYPPLDEGVYPRRECTAEDNPVDPSYLY